MNNNLIQIKVKERLNKLASFDYDNLECWQIAEAFNKAQIQWTRRQVQGYNQLQQGDEGSKVNIDDLQVLTRTALDINRTNYTEYTETAVLPPDYLYFKRVIVHGKTASCPTPVKITCYLARKADVSVLLTDNYRKPSFSWRETFCTIESDRIRVYTNNEFEITKLDVVYYKVPRSVEFNGCVSPSTGAAFTADVETEFKDDIAELLVDETVSILAGDIESMNQYQINLQKSNANT